MRARTMPQTAHASTQQAAPCQWQRFEQGMQTRRYRCSVLWRMAPHRLCGSTLAHGWIFPNTPAPSPFRLPVDVVPWKWPSRPVLFPAFACEQDIEGCAGLTLHSQQGRRRRRPLMGNPSADAEEADSDADPDASFAFLAECNIARTPCPDFVRKARRGWAGNGAS